MTHALAYTSLAYTASQIRRELVRLDRLRSAGPCPVPPPTACSWSDPAWLDLWARNHPDLIDQQQAALTAQLERMNHQYANRRTTR